MSRRKPTKPTPKKAKKRAAPKKPRRRTAADWEPVLLARLMDYPNILAACAFVGINRDTFYERRNKDPQFAKLAREAMGQGVAALECEMHRRAVHGTTKIILSGGKPVMVWVDANGQFVAPNTPGAKEVPLMEREYSDTLAIFLAKAHKPKKFSERYRIEHAGKQPGVNVSVTNTVAVTVSPSEILDRYADVLEQAADDDADPAAESVAGATAPSPDRHFDEVYTSKSVHSDVGESVPPESGDAAE